MRDLRDILRKLRSERNMSQADLAAEIGAGVSTVASWEVGKRFPSRENMEQLADVFNVDIAYLYGISPVRQAVHYDADGTRMVLDTLSNRERNLVSAMRRLTPEGQTKLSEYSELLLGNPKYTAVLPEAAHSINDDPDAIKHDDDIMSDDSEW